MGVLVSATGGGNCSEGDMGGRQSCSSCGCPSSPPSSSSALCPSVFTGFEYLSCNLPLRPAPPNDRWRGRESRKRGRRETDEWL